jgi:hypothetical protein
MATRYGTYRYITKQLIVVRINCRVFQIQNFKVRIQNVGYQEFCHQTRFQILPLTFF